MNQEKTEKKLMEFKTLPYGWNYGQGEPIKESVYEIAVKLIRYINELGITNTDVFPGNDGDVCITGYHFDHYLEVNIEIDLNMSVCREILNMSVCHEIKDEEVLSKESLSLEEAKKILQKIADIIL